MNNNYNKYFTETENGLDIEANNINANCITSRDNKFSLDSEGNLTVNSINFNTSENNLLSFEAIFNKIYPVGAIYISANDVNPGMLFTGVWERIENVFLLGCGSNYTIGSTGGEREHILTLEEMPSHNHMLSERIMVWDDNRTKVLSSADWSGCIQFYPFNTLITNNSGGNKSHNNMPPYLVVNMWKRIS